MYEVELKVETAHADVRTRLAELGAKKLGTRTQTDTYYNAPDRDFAVTDEALRVRRETEDGAHRVRLTYKGPLVDDETKTRKEAETDVDDATAIASILDGLGYDAVATVEKERERHRLGECLVTLDTVSELGEFVEIEYHQPVSERELDAVRETVSETLDALAIDGDTQIQTSYLELVLAGQ